MENIKSSSMKNITDIYDMLISFYNPMGIENEILLMKYLQNIPFEQVNQHKEIFFKILRELMYSHIDDFYCVNEINIIEFENFVKWLNEYKTNFSLKENEFIDGVIAVLLCEY